MKKQILLILTLMILLTPTLSSQIPKKTGKPNVKINIKPYSTIYEGDIINCTIEGKVSNKYWLIDNQSKHTKFQNNSPLIYDPEPTPLNKTYVNLTIYAENQHGYDSDTIPVKIKRIFFGDIHWHTIISDGDYSIDEMYQNAIKDNYLDFTGCTDHAELIDGFNLQFGGVPKNDWIRTLFYKLLIHGEWKKTKDKTNEYYHPGEFTTLLGFEWTAAQWSIGGKKWTPNKWEDVSHINFYYKEVYPKAKEYNYWQKPNYDSIFKTMANENNKGHLNIGFPHHPQGKASQLSFTTNFSFLADKTRNTKERNHILRGAEIYSRWGNAIGQKYTPKLPWSYPYPKKQFYNQTESWIENACWEWSQKNMQNQRFVFIAGSDTHDYNRPASSLTNKSHLETHSGITAVYSVHNTRGEIWDALNNCTCYASQLLKIRANARFDGEITYGKWINCSSPLNINITAHATFQGNDNSGKTMCPHGYKKEKLNCSISDIWIVKKDKNKGQPWCKVIKHFQPEKKVCKINFKDKNVGPNDFYWIAIKQKNDVSSSHKEHMAYLGPVYINKVR
ncbi:MAG: DUF3604 domain-containing protein [Candidatus Thermoplasmatota archaeon]